jgi:hypothetical protein
MNFINHIHALMLTTATVVITAAVIGRCAYRYFTARCVDGTLTGTVVESEHTFIDGTPHVTRKGEWVFDRRIVCSGQGWGVETTSYYATTTTTIVPVIESYSITARDACFNGEPLNAENILAVCTLSGAITPDLDITADTHEVSVMYVEGVPTYIGCRDQIMARFWRDTWLWPPIYIWCAGCIVCILVDGIYGLGTSICVNLSYLVHYQVRRSVYTM